jgi:hypothetical protein
MATGSFCDDLVRYECLYQSHRPIKSMKKYGPVRRGTAAKLWFPNLQHNVWADAPFNQVLNP